MSYGSLWQRWTRGVSWTWVNERYRDSLPADFDATLMALDAPDRLHVKQGRSTARVVFHPAIATSPETRRAAVGLPQAALSAPLAVGLAAMVDPAGRSLARGGRVGPPGTSPGARDRGPRGRRGRRTDRPARPACEAS